MSISLYYLAGASCVPFRGDGWIGFQGIFMLPGYLERTVADTNEAKEGATAGAYVVQEILPMGNGSSTTPKIKCNFLY